MISLLNGALIAINFVSLASDWKSLYSATMPTPDQPTIKAVLFDLDGTLLDTEALSDKAMFKNYDGLLPADIQKVVEQNDYRLPWECKKQLLGLRTTSWVPIMMNYAKTKWGVDTPLSVEEFGANWEANLNNYCEEIVACKGANELVAALAAAGVPMAIATSSRSKAVEKKRKRHEAIFQHMSTIVCGDDPELKHGKPAPDIYKIAAQRMGVDPKECLVFEDAMSGVKSGKAAGCYVVAVPDPRFSPEEKQEFRALADVFLNDLFQFDGSSFGLELNMGAQKTQQSSSTSNAEQVQATEVVAKRKGFVGQNLAGASGYPENRMVV